MKNDDIDVARGPRQVVPMFCGSVAALLDDRKDDPTIFSVAGGDFEALKTAEKQVGGLFRDRKGALEVQLVVQRETLMYYQACPPC